MANIRQDASFGRTVTFVAELRIGGTTGIRRCGTPRGPLFLAYGRARGGPDALYFFAGRTF